MRGHTRRVARSDPLLYYYYLFGDGFVFTSLATTSGVLCDRPRIYIDFHSLLQERYSRRALALLSIYDVNVTDSVLQLCRGHVHRS